MAPIISWSITLIMVATYLAIAGAVYGVLSSAATQSRLPAAAQRRVRIGAGAFLAALLGGALFLAPSPASFAARDPYHITPLIPLFVGGSVGGAFLAIWRSPSLRRVIAAVPVSALHALQSWRVLGVVFIILLAQGQLPAHFALPAGWGDIAVGATAPLLATALARGVRGSRTAAVWWNVLGLLDLVVAVGMGTGLLAPLVMPGVASRLPAAAAMGVFPMMLVPAFAVPASTIVHVLALARLRRRVPRPAAGMVPTAAR